MQLLEKAMPVLVIMMLMMLMMVLMTIALMTVRNLAQSGTNSVSWKWENGHSKAILCAS